MNAGLAEAHDLASRIERIRGGQAGLDRLDAYGRERLAEWGFLLGRAGGLRPGAAASPFVAKNAARLPDRLDAPPVLDRAVACDEGQAESCGRRADQGVERVVVRPRLVGEADLL